MSKSDPPDPSILLARTAAEARIDSMRLRQPASDGSAFAVELFLDLNNGGNALLELSSDDLKKMLELANRASKMGEAKPI